MSNNFTISFEFETNLATDALKLKVTHHGRSEFFPVDGMQFDMNPANTLPPKYAVFHKEFAVAVDQFKAERQEASQVD